MSSLRPKRASFVGSSTVGISRITESGIGNSPMVMHPIDTHVIARIGGRVVGHVGWARREMTVGTEAVTIAGAGGVLVSDEARGQRLGAELMGRAARSMSDHGGVALGYLGCREQVVPFYGSCGWTRVAARERSIGRDGEPHVDEPGQPLLIRPIAASLELWPGGDIDLHERAW